MHANPSTAHPCAHDDEQEHRLEEFRELLATASQGQLFKVRTLIHALAYHDIEPLETLISQWQLEVANAAYNRLLLVGSDTKGAQS